MTAKRLTIVVPVYGRADDLRSCAASVLRHTTGADVDVLIVDDGSPGDQVATALRDLAASSTPVTLRVATNESNLGFAATVNRAFRETSGDVVLLNSDTVVTAGWLDRLAAAAGEPDVATVTPLTNEGSICTLPSEVIDAFDLAGPAPRIDEAGAFIAAHGLGCRPAVITGVGFCMYVTRHAIDVVGELDAERFGRGYGEEVDFCLRATELGLRHLVEDSTFVFHAGGASFGDESEDAKARGSAVLHERHAGFRTANRDERRRDPLAPVMTALRLGLTRRDDRRPHVLHVLHAPSPYGGTEKHLEALVGALIDRYDASVLMPGPGGFVLRTTWRVDGRTVEREVLLDGQPAPLETTVDEAAREIFATVLDLTELDAVHVHNLIGHSLAPLDALRDFAGPVVCTVHDYFLACPHHWLLYRNQVPCGIPDDLALCASCLPETRGLPVEGLVEHRAAVAARLDVVDAWVFPSLSAADQLRSVYDIDEARVHVIPHGTVASVPSAGGPVDVDHVLHDPLRIAFVGRGWGKKGLGVASWLADAVRDTPIEVHHFGESKEAASTQLVAHGAYDNRELPALLRAAGVHVVWLPGPYAETFGLVMAEVLGAGLPVVGPPYGAIGERIRDDQVGWTVDPADHDAVHALVAALDAGRFELLRATERAVAVPERSVEETTPAYAALYGATEPR